MSACSAIVLPAVSGWSACFPCLRLPLPSACFSAPYPPARARRALFPGGEGGDFCLLCRGIRPRHPGLNPRGTGLSRCSDCLGWHFPWNRHKRRPNNRFIREKFWGVWGTLSRVPRRSPIPLMRWRLLKVLSPLEPTRTPSQQQIYSRKVLGGLGDSFKSPPAFPPAFPRFPRFRDSQGLFLENILLF